MRFFTRKSKAVKNWHSRAMIIDLSKTKVTFINTNAPDERLPPWMQEKNR
jgi:hypothetical protein